jgi:hypothetical protein
VRRGSADWGELRGLVEVRPLSQPMARTSSGRLSSPFTASLSSTLDVLRREVRHLRPRRVILEADFREADLRQDGLPRADRNARTPGLVLTLVGTPHGDLRYPCATFGHWDENLRGIALALEALRKVDRYGVTMRGEQYQGWKALPAGEGPSVERGRALIREHGGVVAALKATHPDSGGDEAAFKDVQAAREAAVA